MNRCALDDGSADMLPMLVARVVTTIGCALTRDHSSVRKHTDDAAITDAVLSRSVIAGQAPDSAVSVVTPIGEVQFTGFARNPSDHPEVERLARAVRGLKAVSKRIAVPLWAPPNPLSRRPP